VLDHDRQVSRQGSMDEEILMMMWVVEMRWASVLNTPKHQDGLSHARS